MLFRGKYLWVFGIVMMFFVIASGGCGGGSSSNSNPGTEYDISVLAGTWVASNGTATMTASDENFNLAMQSDGGSYSFSDVQRNGNTATIVMGGETLWTYQNGSRSGTTHSAGFISRSREFQRVSTNVWRCIGDDYFYTITITSPTTLKVEEEVGDSDSWTASYTLTKQSTSETEYDVSVLAGTWVASNGTATRTEYGGTINEVIDDEGDNTWAFDDIQVDGDTASIVMGGMTDWFGQRGTEYVSHGVGYITRAREFQHTDVNVWRFARNETGDNRYYTITITSPTTLKVEEYINVENETENFTFTASYTLTKQSSTIPSINGTWRITGGTLTYYDNGTFHTLNYVPGSSSPEQFTLTVTDIERGDYIIDVGGTGVFKKEGCPYVKIGFTGDIAGVARVVWGTSEYWNEREELRSTLYHFLGVNRYKADQEGSEGAIPDVFRSEFRLTSPSTMLYTQYGMSIESIEGYPADTDRATLPHPEIELTLTRVNDTPASSDTSMIMSELVRVDSAIDPSTGESVEFIPTESFRFTLRRNDDGEHYSVVTDGIVHTEEWHNDGAVDGHIYVLRSDYGWDCYFDGEGYTLSDDGKYVRETYAKGEKVHGEWDARTELTFNNDGTITCKFSIVLMGSDGMLGWHEMAELTLKPVR